MGDVIGDISSRRGKVLGMDTRPAAQAIDARVPLAQMFGYATDLRSMTQGRATYTMQFSHYEPVPAAVAEGIIAKFTALAVLLPIVAGQSGNTGAQALAVTMRGLALREIRPRHWLRVTFKEVNVAFFNGIAVALTTSLGVYVWSRSIGLALVIGISMIISMVAAGLSGAVIPMILLAFGQDPAQSSSIILTTVTDVVGFFSFLGLATLLASMLPT